MRRLLSGISLVRPLNGLVAAASVVVAFRVATGVWSWPWPEIIAVLLLVSFGYSINDIYDLRADRINRPGRAIVSGAISQKTAAIISLLLLIAGAIVAAGGGERLAQYYAVVALLLWLYARNLSGMFLLGNIVVATLCGSVFLLAALSVGETARWNAALMAFSLTFFFSLAREIVKDIEDMDGDRLLRRRTLPLVLGAYKARAAAFTAGFIVFPIAYWARHYVDLTNLYYLLVSLAVNLPIVIIYVIYNRQDPRRGARWVSLALKALMIPALLTLALAVK